MLKFENDKDRERQYTAVRQFCYSYGFYEKDCGDFSKCDYTIRNKQDEVVAYFEVKGVVGKSLNDSKTCLVALKKIAALQETQKMSGTPVVICWAFDDGIAFAKIDNLKGTFNHGGRKEREGSTYDKEILVFVETENLKKIWY